MKKILLILTTFLFIAPLIAGQKVIEKGVMEITNDKTGEVTYKVLWRVPEGKDSYWLDAVPNGSDEAFSGEMIFTIPNMDPMAAITIGAYSVTEEGMKRAVRAIEDVYRAANKQKGGSSSGGGGGCGG